MKKYEKPILEDEEVEIEDICEASLENLGSLNNNPGSSDSNSEMWPGSN